ncbi:type II secretion system protein GspL [Paraferrimonas sedimenticola]|uniref:Type II secretion system protein L n=1 Tax=Paraferrimonas sedimenticola TaxID=375674 RepID=A0AA37RW85_9GAMM|nr:type II secretion system protein GspL [Paraferrimonas sedimenticola]GLP95917.1 type II secretion system protein L [Paraferrimonas sedimenticola]
MSEQVYIRLGRDFDQPISWLLYSTTEDEVIASGELANAGQLEELTERARGKTLDVLVSAEAVTLTQVELPEKGQRQALKALPFMLEEELAQDVEQCHFVVGPIDNNIASVAVVAKAQMSQWLDWLAAAELTPRKMVIDVLSLPHDSEQWSAIQLGEQWLLRLQAGQGMSVSPEWLSLLAAKEVADAADEERDPISVAAYSPLELPMLEVRQQTLELPLLVLAKGAAKAPMNLLSGEFAPKREYFKAFKLWQKVAVVAGVCLLLGMLNNGLQWYLYNAEADALEEQASKVYQQLFNSTPRKGLVRTQIDSKLRELQGGGEGSQLFSVMDELDKAFEEVPSLKLSGIRYDANRQELRLSIKAENFAHIEQFQNLASQQFDVNAGSMNDSGEMITGTITIKER